MQPVCLEPQSEPGILLPDGTPLQQGGRQRERVLRVGIRHRLEVSHNLVLVVDQVVHRFVDVEQPRILARMSSEVHGRI